MKNGKVLSEATLGFPLAEKDTKVLMGFKTRSIGEDCLAGFGGGIELYETGPESLARELKEECGLIARPEDCENVAVMYSLNNQPDGTFFVCRVLIYFIRTWTGKVVDTDEMRDNHWRDISNLPYKDMLPDLEGWLPELLGGEQLIINVHYSPFQKELLAPVEIMPIEDYIREREL